MKQLTIILFFCSSLFLKSGSWELVDNDSRSISYLSIQCYDDFNCVAIGNRGLLTPLVKKTSDGGKTWQTVLIDSIPVIVNDKYTNPHEARCLSFPGPKTCIVGCDSSYYWISNDNANTWEKKKVSSYSKNNIISIEMLNEQFGGMTDYLNFYLTFDGGENWTRTNIVYPDSNQYLRGIYYISIPDSNVIYLIARSNLFFQNVIKSCDRGLTWSLLTNIGFEISSITFIDSLVGFSTGHYKVASMTIPDVIFKTTDGGKSWLKKLDSLTPDYDYGLTKIVWKNKFMLAIGEYNHYWYSYDLGETWQREMSVKDIDLGDYLFDICLPSENVAFAVMNMQSHIYKNQSVNSVKITNTSDDFCRLRKNILNLNEEPILELMSESETGTEIYILNSAGQIINSQHLSLQENTSYSLKFTDNYFSSGVYFVLVQNGNRQQLLKLIIL